MHLETEFFKGVLYRELLTETKKIQRVQRKTTKKTYSHLREKKFQSYHSNSHFFHFSRKQNWIQPRKKTTENSQEQKTEDARKENCFGLKFLDWERKKNLKPWTENNRSKFRLLKKKCWSHTQTESVFFGTGSNFCSRTKKFGVSRDGKPKKNLHTKRELTKVKNLRKIHEVEVCSHRNWEKKRIDYKKTSSY